MKKAIILSIFLSAFSCLKAQWQPVNQPLGGQIITAMTSKGSMFFAGSSCNSVGGAAYFTSNAGTSWTKAAGGFPSQSNISGVDAMGVYGSKVFAGVTNACGGTQAGLFRSDDNGATWVLSNSPMNNLFAQCIEGYGTKLLVCTNHGLLISSDSGSTWSWPNFADTYAYQFYSLAIKDTCIFAGTSNGVMLSTDTGVTWTNVSSGIGTGTIVWRMTYSGSNLLASLYSGGTFKSTNNGGSWVPLAGGFPAGGMVMGFATNGNQTFAAVGTTVYMTNDHGFTWADVGQGLASGTSGAVYSLAIFGGDLYLGTSGSGDIWKRSLSQMADIKSFSNPYKISVFPNPVQDKLVISMASSEKYFLEISDVTGNIILSKYVSDKEDVDINHFSKGVYLLKFTLGKMSEIIRVVKE